MRWVALGSFQPIISNVIHVTWVYVSIDKMYCFKDPEYEQRVLSGQDDNDPYYAATKTNSSSQEPRVLVRVTNEIWNYDNANLKSKWLSNWCFKALFTVICVP